MSVHGSTPSPNDDALLVQWEGTVTETVREVVYGYRACPPDVERECLVEAQMAIAECGARLVNVVERLRGREVRGE